MAAKCCSHVHRCFALLLHICAYWGSGGERAFPPGGCHSTFLSWEVFRKALPHLDLLRPGRSSSRVGRRRVRQVARHSHVLSSLQCSSTTGRAEVSQGISGGGAVAQSRSTSHMSWAQQICFRHTPNSMLHTQESCCLLLWSTQMNPCPLPYPQRARPKNCSRCSGCSRHGAAPDSHGVGQDVRPSSYR